MLILGPAPPNLRHAWSEQKLIDGLFSECMGASLHAFAVLRICLPVSPVQCNLFLQQYSAPLLAGTPRLLL